MRAIFVFLEAQPRVSKSEDHRRSFPLPPQVVSAGPAEIEPDSGKQSTEGRRQYVVVSRCVHDEGGPLGFADQAVLPNHPELHPLRAVVVSVQGKGEMNLVSLPALQVATISLNRRSGAPTTLVNAKNGTTLGAPVFNQADVSR